MNLVWERMGHPKHRSPVIVPGVYRLVDPETDRQVAALATSPDGASWLPMGELPVNEKSHMRQIDHAELAYAYAHPNEWWMEQQL